ncbi:MAG: hypothetical protein AMK69_05295 [Nitrospira bacterium SG8_3]|nr:MAG: hypothetical protein AMK69_05295 [Nitrospira bacterium SG8_3]
MKFYTQTIKNISFLLISLLVFISPINKSLAQEKGEEETYSISLVQTAEVGKEIIEVEDKKILTETYKVEKGDWIWQIFREKGLLQKQNLAELLSMLKTLNKDLADLDVIHPNQEIVIPLVISPVGAGPAVAKKATEPISPETLKDIKLENYTIRRGDTLVKVIRSRYEISDEKLYREYLELVRGLNPSIEDLDNVSPGQIVKLPIWTPQVVRAPVVHKASLKPEHVAQKARRTALAYQLGQILTHMGEEWVHTGHHFIPLKSGGHIDLKGDSFPIVNLFNGYKVIVDLYNAMPEKMGTVIESSWENYAIVHLNENDNLRTAFDKVLPACHYSKIYKLGEPLDLRGDIPFRIAGDWIIQPTGSPGGEKEKMIMITLVDDHTPRTPRAIQDFLRTQGIKVIDYPPADDAFEPAAAKLEVLKAGNDISSLIETILNLTGQPFSRGVEIPIYKSGKSNFNLVMKADFLLKVNEKDCIIDLKGLEPDIATLLEEHQFKVLLLAGDKDPSSIVSKTLDLLGVQFDSKPHDFMAAERDQQKNITLTIPGIVFQANSGKNIFATPLEIPDDIALFLSQRGYDILNLTLS